MHRCSWSILKTSYQFISKQNSELPYSIVVTIGCIWRKNNSYDPDNDNIVFLFFDSILAYTIGSGKDIY